MGNCLPYHPKRDVSLVFVGLDGAGKTTAVNGLAGLPIDSVSPTCGLNTLTFKKGSYNINVLDLGGGSKIRDIWKNYFPEAHGLVFAIDSSDPDRLSETKEVLEKLLDNERIKKKPVLILANKQDNNNALKEDEVRNELAIAELELRSECPCKVMLSAAIRSKPKRRNADKGLIQGLNWLLNEIEHEYDELNTRVTCDVENRRLELEAQMRERMERVKKRRAERERREEAGGDAEAVGESSSVDEKMRPSSRETSFQGTNNAVAAASRIAAGDDSGPDIPTPAGDGENLRRRTSQSSLKSTTTGTKNDAESDDGSYDGKATTGVYVHKSVLEEALREANDLHESTDDSVKLDDDSTNQNPTTVPTPSTGRRRRSSEKELIQSLVEEALVIAHDDQEPPGHHRSSSISDDVPVMGNARSRNNSQEQQQQQPDEIDIRELRAIVTAMGAAGQEDLFLKCRALDSDLGLEQCTSFEQFVEELNSGQRPQVARELLRSVSECRIEKQTAANSPTREECSKCDRKVDGDEELLIPVRESPRPRSLSGNCGTELHQYNEDAGLVEMREKVAERMNDGELNPAFTDTCHNNMSDGSLSPQLAQVNMLSLDSTEATQQPGEQSTVATKIVADTTPRVRSGRKTKKRSLAERLLRSKMSANGALKSSSYQGLQEEEEAGGGGTLPQLNGQHPSLPVEQQTDVGIGNEIVDEPDLPGLVLEGFEVPNGVDSPIQSVSNDHTESFLSQNNSNVTKSPNDSLTVYRNILDDTGEEEPEIPSLKDTANDETGLLKNPSAPAVGGDINNGMEKKKKRKKKKNRVKPMDDDGNHLGMLPSIKHASTCNLPPLNPHSINHAFTHNEDPDT